MHEILLKYMYISGTYVEAYKKKTLHIYVPYNTFPKSQTLIDSFKENPYMN